MYATVDKVKILAVPPVTSVERGKVTVTVMLIAWTG